MNEVTCEHTLLSKIGRAKDVLIEMGKFSTITVSSKKIIPGEQPEKYAPLGIILDESGMLLGIIYFNDPTRGANGKHWILEVYERAAIETAEVIIGKILNLGIEITLRLITKPAMHKK